MACFKRTGRRRKSPNWADIHSDILDSIFEHLSFKDVLLAEAVCANWFKAANSRINVKFQNVPPPIPLLMLPLEGESESSNCGYD